MQGRQQQKQRTLCKRRLLRHRSSLTLGFPRSTCINCACWPAPAPAPAPTMPPSTSPPSPRRRGFAPERQRLTWQPRTGASTRSWSPWVPTVACACTTRVDSNSPRSVPSMLAPRMKLRPLPCARRAHSSSASRMGRSSCGSYLTGERPARRVNDARCRSGARLCTLVASRLSRAPRICAISSPRLPTAQW